MTKKKFHMSSVTLHNQWGSFHWSPGHRGRHRKQPAALPVTSVLLWMLCVVECFLSPVVQENNNNNAMLRKNYSCLHAKGKNKKTHFLFFCHSLGGRSWPAHPEITVSGRSPGSRSERWSEVAEEIHKRLHCTDHKANAHIKITTRQCNVLLSGKYYNFERPQR